MMNNKQRWLVAGLLAGLATPAYAQDSAQEAAQDSKTNPAPRDLCSDRPGLNTPACIVDPERLQVEIGLGDWTRSNVDGKRQDLIEAGEIAFRYGLGPTTEARLGWTSYGHLRTRNKTDGSVDQVSGIGDVRIGVKQSVRHPAEGKTGLALALLPYANLPSGHRDIGAGDWGAGLIVPSSYKLNDTVSLELTPEVDAAVNASGKGRHLAYGSALGIQVHLTKDIRLTPEIGLTRDHDPDQSTTMRKASLSLDVQPSKLLQLDVQCVAGLNRDAPDFELSAGITRKF